MKLKELHESVGKTVADLKIEYSGRGDFECGSRGITSLEGAPSEVGGDFNCDSNNLTSLKGAPNKVDGFFYCDSNKLTSLEGAPSKVDGDFYCHNNKLTSLEGAPSKVDGDFYCDNNKLTSLEGIHLRIKYIGGEANFVRNPIKSHVLGLLMIDGLNIVRFNNKNLENIINKYLKGSRDVIDCQNELMDAGLDEFAQL